MATIKEALNADLSGYSPVNLQRTTAAPPSTELQPSFNPVIRSPLPSDTPTPDSLRQFYMGGKIPQIRILNQ